MNVVRILQAVLVIYLLIRHRDKLRPITRVALVLFLAGLAGNQLNYLTMDFVPDMFVLRPIQGYVFNLADVFVILSMVILVIRLAFFEGHYFTDWVVGKFDSGQKRDKIDGEDVKGDENQGPPADGDEDE